VVRHSIRCRPIGAAPTPASPRLPDAPNPHSTPTAMALPNPLPPAPPPQPTRPHLSHVASLEAPSTYSLPYFWVKSLWRLTSSGMSGTLGWGRACGWVWVDRWHAALFYERMLKRL